jgi:Domain of unknown function (DUF4114)/Cysteine-rich secretory protein family
MSKATPQEQELLELLNRLRMYPESELSMLLNSVDSYVKYALFDYYQVDIDRVKSQWQHLRSTAPLAWSSELKDAAFGHNQKMIQQDTQAHTLPGELTLRDRIAQTGYQSNFEGENLYGSALSILFAHTGWAINWGKGDNTIGGIQFNTSHRQNMMSSMVREVGISVIEENNQQTKIGPLVITENFATREAIAGKAWLLGVAFQDYNEDGWYQAGEGLDGLDVQINGMNGNKFSKTIAVTDTGAYQELLNPGTYRVDFVQDGETLGSQVTTIDSNIPNNVKVDLVLPVRDLGTYLQTGAKESHLLDFRATELDNGQTTSLLDREIIAKAVGITGDAKYQNHVGFYRVENSQGTVIDPIDNRAYAPGDVGYVEAALRRSQISGDGMSFDRGNVSPQTTLDGGYIYAPFIVANGSVNDFLKGGKNSPNVFFNYQGANTDGLEHIKMLSPNKFGFEDTFNGGDIDYNDFIFQVVADVA